MEETLEKTIENVEKTNEDYLDPETKKFKEGNPGGGRPKDTPEDKIAKKATKQLIKDYQEKLAEALVKIEPVLVAKAIEGDVQAIKELHDRAMGKARQVVGIEGGEEGSPILIAKEVADKFEDEITSIPSNSSQE